MQYLKLLIISILFLLGACSGGSDSSDSSPSTQFIYTDIHHRHNTFYAKWGSLPNSTIDFSVSARVNDPQGLDNLESIYFYNEAEQWYWTILDVSAGHGLQECYVPSVDIFECFFYHSASLDSIRLSGWVLEATDKQGNVSRQSFEFSLPSLTTRTNEYFAFSDAYLGSTLFGTPVLEALTITDNEILFVSNPGTQSFRIEFRATDNSAAHYSFAFYDDSPDIEFIGYVPLDSASIENRPITLGQKVVVDIPWSEIEYRSGYSATDINGLHIKLYDSPVDWEAEVDGLWFNHISYSEFITL